MIEQPSPKSWRGARQGKNWVWFKRGGKKKKQRKAKPNQTFLSEHVIEQDSPESVMVNWWRSVWPMAGHRPYRNPAARAAGMRQSIPSRQVPGATGARRGRAAAGASTPATRLSRGSAPSGGRAGARCGWTPRNSNSYPRSRRGFCARRTGRARTAEMTWCWSSEMGWRRSPSAPAAGR